jgi:molecular chaperone GrpE
MTDKWEGAPEEDIPGGAPEEKASAGQAAPQEIETLRRELGECQARADEMADKYRRSVAEFANYRKRQERDQEQQSQRVTMDVVRQLLPIIDDLSLARSHVPAEYQDSDWVQGVLLIERKMEALLARFEVVPIEAAGKPFDPNFHEALVQMPSDEHAEGIVIEDLQRGYLLRDQVVRPSRVKVSSGPA